ncbi:type 4b pilus protein PilO2 [Variovorax sp. ZS18.2.2]|uniref:type 4b pilus protein PilO2 n=1 Tax=Variovorax sp. ZS18.2.2 TaxID=2971255 RepID=UPI0021516890|nr:type 4b pilus protein PilO2 [Variovorax sp. ZS18.2.2]MCR6481014.1 type 4b pilus protein PilO2 [Variovorax sp. ZS18.2.2]
MSSNVVYTAPGGKPILIGGLEWRLLPAVVKTGELDASIRELAGDIAARHLAQAVSSVPEELRERGKTILVKRGKVGFYLPPEGESLPRGAHSLASAFATWSAEHSKALLSVRLADGRCAVVVVINGLPVLDKVETDHNAAFDLASAYLKDDISVFSDDVVRYPGALVHQDLLEAIGHAAGKDSVIKAVPVNVRRLAIAAFLVAGLLGGLQYWMQWKKEQERLALLERQREADPVPKYLNALAAARQDVGIQREAIKAGIDFAMRVPLSPEGWNASRIGCAAHAGCEVLYARTTGTFEGLAKAVPFLTLVPAEAIDLNQARMTWNQPLATAALNPETQLPAMTAFVQGPEASKLQDWLVAGLSIQLTPQQLWPQAEGVPASFKHPAALATGKFDLDAIPLPQLQEAVATAPTNVSWTAWSIEIGDAKQEPLARAKGRMTGNYYVTSN